MVDQGIDKKVKKTISAGFKVLIGIVALTVAGFIIWGGVKIAGVVPSVGEKVTSTSINLPPVIKEIVGIFLGLGSPTTAEALAVHIAIFAILFFALSDLISMFTAFSDTVSWIIGGALAVVAGATRMINGLAGIFGVGAGLGALGILIIIASAIFAGVVFHIGLGKTLRRWAFERQMVLESLKAEKGTEGVMRAVRGLKKISSELEEE